METCNELLTQIYETGLVQDAAGQSHPVNSGMDITHADALYRTVLKQKPQTVVEVGMAHGLSSLAILTALRDVGAGGKLISIDPNQHTDYMGIGMANVKRADLADAHRLVEELDYLALPQLLTEKVSVDFAYIDGWHTFDYVLLDFFFLDKMLRPGGVVAFDDCGYTAIYRVLRFVQTHRKYRELDTGLKPDYRARNAVVSLGRRILGRPTHNRYFQKEKDWEPTWNFYASF